MTVTKVVMFTAQFPLHGLRDSGMESSGQGAREESEALSGMLRNLVILTYDYLGGKKVGHKARPRKGTKPNAFSQCWSGAL